MKTKPEYVAMEFKIDSDLYAQVKEVLIPFGLTPEEAIVLFIKETVRQGKIPFEYTEEDLLEAKRLCEEVGWDGE